VTAGICWSSWLDDFYQLEVCIMVLRQKMSLVLSKRLLVLGFGLAAAISSHVARADSCGESVDAPGKVFYVIPDGDLVAREVTLTVPACGEGAVVLSSASGWRTETTTFWSKEVAGRKVFVVVFQNPKGDNPNHYLVLKGSYIRGKNAAKYWGDMYTLTLPEGQGALLKDAQQFDSQSVLGHYGRHAGGFGFKAVVPQSEPELPVPAPQAPSFME
jgi:hypothetical protein